MGRVSAVGIVAVAVAVIRLFTREWWVVAKQRSTRGTAFAWEKPRHRTREEAERHYYRDTVILACIGIGMVVIDVYG